MGETTTRSELFEALTMGESDLDVLSAPTVPRLVRETLGVSSLDLPNSPREYSSAFLPDFFWTAVVNAARHRFAFLRFAHVRASIGRSNRSDQPATREERRRRYALPAHSKNAAASHQLLSFILLLVSRALSPGVARCPFLQSRERRKQAAGGLEIRARGRAWARKIFLRVSW